MRIKMFAVAMLLASSLANATGIAEIEFRSWDVCDKKEVAEDIASMALIDAEAAFWAWERARKYQLCYRKTAAMMPHQVVWRKQLVDKSVLRVVRIVDDANINYYWITFEPVTGEPPL